jgi:hypothetical protein
MGSPHLEDTQRPLLCHRNLAADEESTSHRSGWLILTCSVGGVRLSVAFLLLIWTSFELWTSRFENVVFIFYKGRKTLYSDIILHKLLELL